MPPLTAAVRKIAIDEPTSRDAAEDAPAIRVRSILGAGLLLRLVRLSAAANEDRSRTDEVRRPVRHTAPNHCEFDYDYYVALQSRRRHQPSRLHHRESSGGRS